MIINLLKYTSLNENYFLIGIDVINRLQNGPVKFEVLYKKSFKEIDLLVFINALTFLFQADIISLNYNNYIMLNETTRT
jgi:hypothetical protein